MEQFIRLFLFAAIKDDTDVLRLPEDHPTISFINQWIIHEHCVDVDLLQKKYLVMGSNFKALKISCKKANGSLWKICLNLPYFVIISTKMQKEVNIFYSDPTHAVLSDAWNMPGVAFT